jgi:tetratricopeptide (TPR) repeat protein
LGDTDPDTLTSMNNLASAYRDGGAPRKALPLLREVLDRRRAALGDRDPDTLTSLSNLAVGYWSAGQPEAALPLHEEAFRLRTAALGPYHADTLVSMSNLGSSCRAARQLDRALALQTEAVQLCQARLGNMHPSTLFAMSNLALTYEAADQVSKAQALREEVLVRRKVRLGDGHPDTLQSLSELAQSYSLAGQPDRALPLLEQAAAGVERLEFVHRHASRIVQGLCACHEGLKQFDRAEAWRRKWLAAVTATDGPGTLAFAAAQGGLGANLHRQQRYAEAESVLRECLAYLQTAQPDVWMTHRTRAVLGAALLGQKCYTGAEPFLVQGYLGMTRVAAAGRGPTPPAPSAAVCRVEALEGLVRLYGEWGRPADAARWQKELEEAKGPPRPPAER